MSLKFNQRLLHFFLNRFVQFSYISFFQIYYGIRMGIYHLCYYFTSFNINPFHQASKDHFDFDLNIIFQKILCTIFIALRKLLES